MNNHYDILIIGAGMVGTSLALSLKSLPLRIAIVDANPVKTTAELDADTRSLALTYGTSHILQNINLWTEIENYATPIETVHISDRGHFGVTRIKASQEKVPALGYVVPAPVLGVELNKKILSLSEIKLFNPATVQSIQKIESTKTPLSCQRPSWDDDPYWQIELSTTQGSQTVTANLIAAADGTHSTIRKLLNISATTHNYEQSAIATSVTLTRDHNNVAYERFTDKGALAFLPLQNSRGGLVWTAPNAFIQELQELTDEQFLQRAQEYFGYRLGKFIQLGKRHVYPLTHLKADEQIREGLVLLGNAAHTLHPLAAQGFNLGLLDVALLVRVIKDAVQTNESYASLNTLQKYQAKCMQSQQKIMQFTNGLIHVFARDFFPLTLARNTGLIALDIFPSLKKRLAKRLMGMSNYEAFL